MPPFLKNLPIHNVLKTHLLRIGFNYFPAYRRTGARITHISPTWLETQITLPLNWKTRNYVGTIFGGSIYGAVDPIYMVMFIKLLGPEYIVWDKSARIEFKRPGRSTLKAVFKVEESELRSIREELEKVVHLNRIYSVEVIDENGKVCAIVEKVLYFKKKGNSK